MEPIKVPVNTGLVDGLQAAGRYAVVIVGFVTAILGLLKVHDLAGMITLIQNNGGSVLAAVSGLIALGTAAYGVFKSNKRGAQLETLVPLVPDKVADFK